jgi:hypothetical protein
MNALAYYDKSAKKINFLIKAMIEKGFIKAENFKNFKNKNAYLYLLAPMGFEEKAKKLPINKKQMNTNN